MPRNNEKKRSKMEDEDEEGWWDVMYKLAMPLLYIMGLIAGMTGAICMGVITNYWAQDGDGKCFLYAKTASSSVVYRFGSDLVICNWVTYGAVTSVVIAFITGLVYIILVRGNKDLSAASACSLTGILLAFLLMLAVTCTMAEGMRITCTSMGLNSANNKGENCYDKLDLRAMGEQLPVQTSTLVRSAVISLICSTIVFFIICCFHLSDFYRRTLRRRYGAVHYVDYDDQR